MARLRGMLFYFFLFDRGFNISLYFPVRCSNTNTIPSPQSPSIVKKAPSVQQQTSSTSMIRSETALSPASTSVQQADSTEQDFPSHIDPQLSIAE